MSTRLKRPAFWRHIGLFLLLGAFQGYLGYSYFTGQFGIESQEVLEGEIEELSAQSAALGPDLVSERARALLSMSEPDDYVIMVDPHTGKPISGSGASSTTNLLSDEIADGVD
jgi:cell division protein FtsB